MTTDFVKGIIYAHLAHNLSDSTKTPENHRNNKGLQYPVFTLETGPHDHISLQDLAGINKTLILTQLCEEEPAINLDGHTLTFRPYIGKSNFQDLK